VHSSVAMLRLQTQYVGIAQRRISLHTCLLTNPAADHPFAAEAAAR